MSVVIPSLRAVVAVPGWAKNELWRRAQAVPSLDLRFADNKSLVDATTGQSLVTFTRTSSGTFTDSAGTLQTAATDVPRFDHNPTTGESLGLLVEEARTNLRLNSATYQPTSGGTPAAYTVDQVAPDGTTTGSRQTAATPRTFEDYTGIANALYTFSFYCRVTSGTASFSFQLKNAATDTVITSDSSPVATTTWKRFSISGTTNGATPGARVELVGVVPGFVLWGTQLEAGAFPTSYIPTTTAAATRAADVASITGSAFSSWYRQDEGTVFVDALRTYSGNFPVFPNIYSFNDGTANNLFGLYGAQSTQNVTNFSIQSGGASQTDFVQVATNVPGPNRIAQALAVNSSTLAANGALTLQDSSVAMPVGINRVSIGSDRASAAQWGGTIRRLTYWPQALPSRLQSITQ
jgi:hypothetical protein